MLGYSVAYPLHWELTIAICVFTFLSPLIYRQFKRSKFRVSIKLLFLLVTGFAYVAYLFSSYLHELHEVERYVHKLDQIYAQANSLPWQVGQPIRYTSIHVAAFSIVKGSRNWLLATITLMIAIWFFRKIKFTGFDLPSPKPKSLSKSEYGAFLIRKGYLTFTRWAYQMTQEFGMRDEQELRNLYQESRKYDKNQNEGNLAKEQINAPNLRI